MTTADDLVRSLLTTLDGAAEAVGVTTFVEPCPDCAAGDHDLCDGTTLDHAIDQFVPCPCRETGHRA